MICPESALKSQLEAIILASDEPLSLQKMRDILGAAIDSNAINSNSPDSNNHDSSDIRTALSDLQTHYQTHGINLLQVAGGWQFRTAPEHAQLVQQLWHSKPPRLSRSALETLAIIAYRQPTTRAEIEALRGVRLSSHMIASLQERGWIKVLGRKEVPGRPHLYGTGKQFLIDFGLNGLKDLPDSAQLLDEDEIQKMVNKQTIIEQTSIEQATIEQPNPKSKASNHT